MALDKTLEEARFLLSLYRDLLVSLGSVNNVDRGKITEASKRIDRVRDELKDEILLAQLRSRRVM